MSALILQRSGLGLLIGKFCHFLTVLSAYDRSAFSFPDVNFSNCQWVFTKLGVCIDVVEICFGIAVGQILSILTEFSAHDTSMFSFLDDNLSKYQWIFTKLDMCIDIMDICFGIGNGRTLSIFDSYLPAIRPYFTFRTIT